MKPGCCYIKVKEMDDGYQLEITGKDVKEKCKTIMEKCCVDLNTCKEFIQKCCPDAKFDCCD